MLKNGQKQPKIGVFSVFPSFSCVPDKIWTLSAYAAAKRIEADFPHFLALVYFGGW